VDLTYGGKTWTKITDSGGVYTYNSSNAVVTLSHVAYRSAWIADVPALTRITHDAGALLVWRSTPSAAKTLITGFLVLAPIPYYLLAMLLIFALSYNFGIFPSNGITTPGRIAAPGFDFNYFVDIIYHSILPALSIIIAGIGGWALGMRGMMVTVLGEDYLTLAEAKGLKNRRIFLRYAVRNAMLPQFTALAITLGYVVSGSVIVELIFSYPGVGYQLFRAISSNDFPVIQGITFFLVLAIASAILVIDLIYPLLDPRITYNRR
jgi:peptide/nickel transport system permease protein